MHEAHRYLPVEGSPVRPPCKLTGLHGGNPAAFEHLLDLVLEAPSKTGVANGNAFPSFLPA